MAKRTFSRSVVLSALIGLSACTSHMVVGENTSHGAPEGDAETMTMNPGEGELVDCGVADFKATRSVKPVDIIFVIDNSSSMSQEIAAVEENISTNFAQIIEDSGIDYRVVILSRHGNSTATSKRVCIEEPLADWSQDGVGCAKKQLPGINEGKFYHYSLEISSKNSLGAVLRQFDGPREDEFALAVGGYKQWLRPEAFKVFIEITDDKVATTYPGGSLDDKNTAEGGELVAEAFDAALLERSPEYFGTPEARNYRWYSIVGTASKDPENPSEPWLPEDEITTDRCKTADNKAPSAGTGYQALSRLTGGLRFPVCNVDSYDVVFNHVAEGIIEQQAVACEYDLPQVPVDKLLDLDSLSIEYTEGGTSTAVAFELVADESECSDGAFYVDGEVVRLCAQSCTTVQADTEAAVELRFQCTDILK